jgi:CBS domain-containing protein
MSPVQPAAFSRQAYWVLPVAICAASLITRCNLHHALVKDVMTADCKTIYSDSLAAEVLQIMDSTGINGLPAGNVENELIGALDMRDLLRAGVV